MHKQHTNRLVSVSVLRSVVLFPMWLRALRVVHFRSCPFVDSGVRVHGGLHSARRCVLPLVGVRAPFVGCLASAITSLAGSPTHVRTVAKVGG
mgnify:CR=1 FL=1